MTAQQKYKFCSSNAAVSTSMTLNEEFRYKIRSNPWVCQKYLIIPTNQLVTSWETLLF